MTRWDSAAFVTAALVTVLAGPARAADRIDRYVSLALQGRLAGADSLWSAGPEPLTPAEERFAAKYRARFFAQSDPALVGVGPFAASVVDAYRRYWTRSLRAEADSAEAERDLAQDLERSLATQMAARSEDVFADVQAALAKEGLFALGGRTVPYLELMLWARQDTSRFDVELDDGVQQVEVVFVREFLVKGWSDWATLGRASTGGWATRERLFCLGDDYDLNSERFLVSYLKHEGRHFADYAKFPELEQLDLEYRGKLTELAWSDTTTNALLAQFAASGAPNPSSPHAWANWLVTEDMSFALFGERIARGDDARWRSVRQEEVRRAARDLLAGHTARLVAAGAETTRGVLREEREAARPEGMG